MGKWKDQWIFWVAPALGAIASAAIYKYVFADFPGADAPKDVKDIEAGTAPGKKISNQ